MSSAIRHNSGPLNGDQLSGIIRSRNQSYLLADRRVGSLPLFKAVSFSDTTTWEANRFFPTRQLYYSWIGEYMVQENRGTEIVELYRGKEQATALEHYNKE